MRHAAPVRGTTSTTDSSEAPIATESIDTSGMSMLLIKPTRRKRRCSVRADSQAHSGDEARLIACACEAHGQIDVRDDPAERQEKRTE